MPPAAACAGAMAILSRPRRPAVPAGIRRPAPSRRLDIGAGFARDAVRSPTGTA